jgi:hypothetical protein
LNPGGRLVRVLLTGAGAAARAGGFDRLAERLRLPLTARLDFLDRYAACYPEWTPWLIGVRDASTVDGEWRAGALLARRRRHGLTRVTALGQPVNDHGRLAALDGPAAAALAGAIADELAALPGPWTLRLEQLPVGDAVATMLVGRLRHARLVPGVGLPRTKFTADRAPRSYVSKKFLQQVNQAYRQFGAVGVDARLLRLHTAAEIEPLLPALLAVHRARDRAALYRPELEDGRRVAWWQDTMLRFARRGQLELTVLDVGDGLPAGYLAALLDGTRYRCWDGRMNPAWSREGSGQLLFGELLRHALADPRWTEIDYLRGETSFKGRLANEVLPTCHLLAWSSRAVELAVESPAEGHRRLHDWKAAHPAADRLWRAARHWRAERAAADR